MCLKSEYLRAEICDGDIFGYNSYIIKAVVNPDRHRLILTVHTDDVLDLDK